MVALGVETLPVLRRVNCFPLTMTGTFVGPVYGTETVMATLAPTDGVTKLPTMVARTLFDPLERREVLPSKNIGRLTPSFTITNLSDCHNHACCGYAGFGSFGTEISSTVAVVPFG